jgi:predicted Fe-Mo cluster-binding NifX family protein
MTVAVPLFGSRVSPRFDCAADMLLVKVENGRVATMESVAMGAQHSLARVNWLYRQGVQVVICGGISGFSLRMMMDRGLRVLTGVTGDADDALQLFLNNQLQGDLVIGPGGRGRRCRRRGGGGSGRPPGRFSE